MKRILLTVALLAAPATAQAQPMFFGTIGCKLPWDTKTWLSVMLDDEADLKFRQEKGPRGDCISIKKGTEVEPVEHLANLVAVRMPGEYQKFWVSSISLYGQ